MQIVGDLDPGRAAALEATTAAHRTTEQAFRFIDGGGWPYELIHMDEYTIDIVVRLPDGLVLVYDTT